MSEEHKPGALLEKEEPAPADKKVPTKEEQMELARKNQDKIDGDNPRFKEVYKKSKDLERAMAEKEKDIDAMREHVLKMERKLSEVAEKQAERKLPPEPDKELDPEAHKAWVKVRDAEAETKREKREQEKEVQLAIRIVSAQYDDYEDVIKVAEKHMAKNQDDAKKVWADPVQAPARAYRLGKKLMEDKNKVSEQEKAEEAARLKRIKSGELLEDGGEGGGGDEEPELSPEQVRVIKNLYRDIPYAEAKKRYIANMGGK